MQDNPNSFEDVPAPIPPESLRPTPRPVAPVAPQPNQQAAYQPPAAPIQPPPPPPPAPPIPSFEKPKRQGGSKVLGLIVAVVAIVIILGLAGVFYFYAIKGFSTTPTHAVVSRQPTPPATPPAPPADATKLVVFTVPSVLPTTIKSGSCWVNSIADPYRPDAWRCTVANTIYDPCFQIATNKNEMFCQMDPTNPASSFLIQLTKALPQVAVAPTPDNSWAWFAQLSDGTLCSPFTGTRPVINGQTAFYGCRSADKMQELFLMGDLTKGTVWTANELIAVKQGTTLTVKTQQTVKLETIWQ